MSLSRKNRFESFLEDLNKISKKHDIWLYADELHVIDGDNNEGFEKIEYFEERKYKTTVGVNNDLP